VVSQYWFYNDDLFHDVYVIFFVSVATIYVHQLHFMCMDGLKIKLHDIKNYSNHDFRFFFHSTKEYLFTICAHATQ